MQLDLFNDRPTDQQAAVIAVDEGVVGVVAVPGSGKTYALAKRCDRIVTLDSCLVLAFNRDAKQAFKSRVNKATKKLAEIRTVNGFCCWELGRTFKTVGMTEKPKYNETFANGISLLALREAGHTADFTWLDARLDKEYVEYVDTNFYDAELPKIRESLTERRKAHVIDGPEHKKLTIKIRCIDAVQAYRKWIINKNIYTHNSAVRLLAQHPEAVQSRFAHLMIDEFQDIDRFQWDVLKVLAAPAISFMTVGDPNQRIYEWRGALEDSFGTMSKEFPKLKLLELSTNFRSSSEITEKAQTICEANIVSHRGSCPGSVRHISSLEEISLKIAASPHEFAVLCRYRMECLETRLWLYRNRIPARIRKDANIMAIAHIALAYQFRLNGGTLEELCTSSTWTQLMGKPQYKREHERIAALEDATILFKLSTTDLEFVKKLSDDKGGVLIATVHSTKGDEFSNVVFRLPTDPKEDPYVNYVAVTRAKDALYLLPSPGVRRAYEPPSGPKLDFMCK